MGKQYIIVWDRMAQRACKFEEAASRVEGLFEMLQNNDANEEAFALTRLMIKNQYPFNYKEILDEVSYRLRSR